MANAACVSKVQSLNKTKLAMLCDSRIHSLSSFYYYVKELEMNQPVLASADFLVEHPLRRSSWRRLKTFHVSLIQQEWRVDTKGGASAPMCNSPPTQAHGISWDELSFPDEKRSTRPFRLVSETHPSQADQWNVRSNWV